MDAVHAGNAGFDQAPDLNEVENVASRNAEDLTIRNRNIHPEGAAELGFHALRDRLVLVIERMWFHTRGIRIME
jgi:hypothetical protein